MPIFYHWTFWVYGIFLTLKEFNLSQHIVFSFSSSLWKKYRALQYLGNFFHSWATNLNYLLGAGGKRKIFCDRLPDPAPLY